MSDLNAAQNHQDYVHGLVVVNTGNGKGKTTAALGLLFRASGHNQRACMIQFIKSEDGQWGEVKTAERLQIEWFKMGDGFVWNSQDIAETRRKALQAWDLARQKIVSGLYRLVVLDEFTYPLHYGWLDTGEIIDWLREHKPADLHLVITGRYAPQALIDYADLVTEMQLVKHPFKEGIPGQPGIEY
ncbi:MAG: cob(I)yrinic acid a,c-diamide adenosyltransferase [Anaerolineae bacterium]|nr:cob(I)yrinic acid a,c-diamide adenosyltransferase [Anaerolineae bacterium]